MDHMIMVKRQDEPIKLVAQSDSLTKNVHIRYKFSNAFLLNIMTPYCAGALVDLTNGKRYTYPTDIYLNMDNHF